MDLSCTRIKSISTIQKVLLIAPARDTLQLFLSEQLPYVGKRIKQNLQNINFDDDSEDDDDWSKKAKTDFADKIPSLNKIKPRERLPRR